VEPLVQHVVHAALAYIVAGRDHVLTFASPMSEPDVNSVIERESVRHLSRLAAAITIPVTKAAGHENSSRSCRMRAIGNLLYAAPSNRSEQSCRQGDETGEQQQVVQGTDGHRSPALCSIPDSASQDVGQNVMEDWLN
jgi:hypothetical protein